MVEVRRTVEFERIAELPRRVLTREAAESLAREITPLFAAPGSKAARLGLTPWQAVSIDECATVRGGWLALPVGSGKTLLAELLPRALGTEGETVLILPAVMREKTYAERGELARDGWLLSNPPPRIISREEMQTEAGLELLQRIKPRAIIIDEADEFSNASASAPARVDRYVAECDAEGRECIVIPMTGSPSRKSIMGYWHLLCWALGEGAPVPRTVEEATLWAQAIDQRATTAKGKPRDIRRPKPGPLGPSVEAAREWYARRLRETPGVVIVDEDSAGDLPLRVEVRYAREDTEIDAAFARFLREGVAPNGDFISDPLSAWRIDTQIGSGIHMYYDPPPPAEWRDAQRAVAGFVCAAIERSRRTSKPLDTEGAVFRAYPDAEPVVAWREVKGTFDAVAASRVRWLSTSAIESVRDWLHGSPDPAVIMTGSVPFGMSLAQSLGLDYYGEQGRTSSGRQLHAADPRSSLVASWYAAKRGFNLQKWSRMLICQPPPSARYLEQIFGRLHRQGARRAVTVTILATSGGTVYALRAAIEEARFVRGTVSLTQKIMRADVHIPPPPRATETNRYRWATASPVSD